MELQLVLKGAGGAIVTTPEREAEKAELRKRRAEMEKLQKDKAGSVREKFKTNGPCIQGFFLGARESKSGESTTNSKLPPSYLMSVWVANCQREDPKANCIELPVFYSDHALANKVPFEFRRRNPYKKLFFFSLNTFSVSKKPDIPSGTPIKLLSLGAKGHMRKFKIDASTKEAEAEDDEDEDRGVQTAKPSAPKFEIEVRPDIMLTAEGYELIPHVSLSDIAHVLIKQNQVTRWLERETRLADKHSKWATMSPESYTFLVLNETTKSHPEFDREEQWFKPNGTYVLPTFSKATEDYLSWPTEEKTAPGGKKDPAKGQIALKFNALVSQWRGEECPRGSVLGSRIPDQVVQLAIDGYGESVMGFEITNPLAWSAIAPCLLKYTNGGVVTRIDIGATNSSALNKMTESGEHDFMHRDRMDLFIADVITLYKTVGIPVSHAWADAYLKDPLNRSDYENKGRMLNNPVIVNLSERPGMRERCLVREKDKWEIRVVTSAELEDGWLPIIEELTPTQGDILMNIYVNKTDNRGAHKGEDFIDIYLSGSLSIAVIAINKNEEAITIDKIMKKDESQRTLEESHKLKSVISFFTGVVVDKPVVAPSGKPQIDWDSEAALLTSIPASPPTNQVPTSEASSSSSSSAPASTVDAMRIDTPVPNTLKKLPLATAAPSSVSFPQSPPVSPKRKPTSEPPSDDEKRHSSSSHSSSSHKKSKKK